MKRRVSRYGTAVLVLALAVLVATAPVAAATNTGVASIHTTDSDFSAGSLTNTTVEGSGDAAYVELEQNDTVDSFEDQDLSEYSGDTSSFSITSGDTTDGSYKLESTASANPMVSTSGLPTYYDRGAGNLTVDVELNGGDGIVIFGASGLDNHFDVSIDGSSDTVRIRERSGGGSAVDLASKSATLPDTDYIRVLVDWDTNGDIFVKFTNTNTGSTITTLSTTDGSDFGDGVGFNTRTAGIQFDNVRAGLSAPDGEYISQSHNAEDVTEGFANLTLENATAHVTWQRSTDGGSSWTDVASSTYTTDGNKTLALSGAGEDWRVNVTFVRDPGETTARLHDEGVRFTNTAPTVDNSSADPNDELVQSSQITLTIGVNDTDFPTAQGDTVDVTFYEKAPDESSFSAVGTDTLNSNGTAATTIEYDLGGEHEWYVVAEDSYGGSQQSATFNATVPATIEIRNETRPDEYVKGNIDVTVRLFSDDEETVIERTVSDGNVSLAGVPVNQGVAVKFEADGWYTRTVYIESIFQQDTAYLLNKSAVPNANTVEFGLEDPSAAYGPQSILYIERALNISGNTSWAVVEADEFGADGVRSSMVPQVRYRLRISNGRQTAQMGSYTPPNTTADAVVLRPDAPAVELTEDTPLVINASVDDSGTLHIAYVDNENKTEEVTFTVVNRFDNSDVLFGPKTYYDQQSISITEPVGTLNESYFVRVEGVRNGSEFNATVPLGPEQQSIVPPGLSLVWIQVAGIGLLLVVGGLFSQFNVSVGVLVTSLFAGVLWYVGLLQGVASWATVALAITFSVLYGLVVNR